MRAILPFSLGIVFASLGAPLPQAQTTELPATPMSPEECQVSPTDGVTPPAANSLTDTLAPCNGVLAPPAVGDQDLTVSPPALGATPIIPPELVPPQRPQGQ